MNLVLLRTSKSAAARARPLLTTRDPSTPSTLKDEAVQWCCGVSLASEQGTWPSPRACLSAELTMFL